MRHGSCFANHVIVRGHRWRSLDIGDHTGRFLIAGFGKVDLVAHPLNAAFCTVPGLRVIGRGGQLRRGSQLLGGLP
jgi:hypothetical protein